MIQNIIGPPVRGQDLFGREDFIELLWYKLQRTNVLLAAPRRFGKTSVMYYLLDHPRDDFQLIHLDLEKITEPVNFIIELIEALNQDSRLARFVKSGFEKTGNYLRNLINSVQIEAMGIEFKIELKEKIKAHWQEFGSQIFRELRNCPEKLIFILDEFALMLENFEENKIPIHEQKAFLSWFRDFRQDPTWGLKNSHFLLGSSISIEQHLAAMHISAVINDFERIILPELNTQQATKMLDLLLESEKLEVSDTSKKLILKLIGPPIPYFIQIFVSELSKIARIKKQKIGPQKIEQIYQEQILGINCKHYFIHYHERLRHYNQNRLTANQFLKQLCLTDQISKTELLFTYKSMLREYEMEAFNQLLSDLENDFYIKYRPADDSFYFATHILKDWWRRYYAL